MTARTLLDIAGVVRRSPSFAESVPILIDHQLEYQTGNLRLDGIDEAVRENAALLTMARSAKAPIIHIVTHGRPGSPIFEPSGPFVKIIPELAPLDGEPVILKKLPSSFAGTTLEQAIRETGRRSLIFTGFMTHMCVSTTVRAALDLGFESTVVAAATATRDLPDPLGGVVPAGTVQRTALAELADRFALIVPDSNALATATTARA